MTQHPRGEMDEIPEDVRETAMDVLTMMDGCMCDICVGKIARVLMAERERCAMIADAYADENIAMAGDTILMDPILNRRPGDRKVTAEDVAKSDDLMVGGTIHSSMFHAAQNIAAAIRKGPTP